MRKSQYANRQVTFVGMFGKKRYTRITITGPRDEVVKHVMSLHLHHTGERVPAKKWEQAWYDRVVSVSHRVSTETTYMGHWLVS